MSFFYNLNKKMADLAKKQDQRLDESISAVEESKFSKLAKEIGKNPKVTNPSAVAASIGREKYGQKEMTRRSVAGRKDEGVDKEAFAKLAPPTDKITFADKIAGAKKEVDEMLGDVAAEAIKSAIGGKQQVADEGNAFTGKLKSTPKGGKFKLGNKEFTDTSDIDEGYAEMDAWLKQREKEKGTGKFDKKKISTGTVYTRKMDDEPEADKDDEGNVIKKGRGRPKGAPKGPERVTGKAWKHKAGRQAAAEDLDTDGVMMTRPSNMSSESVGDSESSTAIKLACALLKKHGYKVSKAEEELDEKAVSKKQQKFMGMVHAAQKGEKPASKEVGKVAKSMGKKDAKDFASTKHKGLPEKVTEKESTEKEDSKAERAGKRVAKDIEHDEGHKGRDDNKAEKAGKKVTKDIEYDDKKDKEEKVKESNKGGYNFGGGVYESVNSKVENMINESMSVNISVDDQGKKSISVNATDADAEALAELLKMAGLGSKASAQEVCGGCGSAECACDQEMVDENSPDWPTDQVTSDDSLQYSGGLNKPKSTGQTTTPVIASQLRRQVSMEENVQLERSLFNTWKNYKG